MKARSTLRNVRMPPAQPDKEGDDPAARTADMRVNAVAEIAALALLFLVSAVLGSAPFVVSLWRALP